MEVLVAGDAEAAAVGFLRAGLGSRGYSPTVSTRVPSVMPVQMVRVSLTGGTRRDVVTDRAQLTIECWDASSVTASNMARLAHGLMHSAAQTVQGVWVRAVEDVSGVQFFPDPDTNDPRYQFTVRWHTRPEAV